MKLFAAGGHGVLSLFYLLRAMGMTVLAGAFLDTLLDSRFDRRRARIVGAVWIGVVILVNFPLAALLGSDVYMRLTPLLLNLPVFVLFGWLSRHRGGRMFFTLMTLMVEISLVTLAGMLCALPFDGSPGADLLGRFAAAFLLLALNGRLRPLYLDMQETLHRGWFLFSLIPLAYYVSLYIYIMRVEPGRRADNLTEILVSSGMVTAAYAVIFFFFQDIRRSALKERERQLLRTQVDAQRRQAATICSGEAQLAAIRHDIRFYMQNIGALLQDNKPEEALRFVRQYDQSILSTSRRRWCENSTLDAILNFYLEQAGQDGIEVSAHLDIPEDLPLDIVELSTVFANAIENALIACRRQPEGEPRRIELNAVTTPQFAVEIANTFSGQVRFGPDGLPVTDQPGHGFGTRSIAAYARKHGAILHYKAEDGVFRVYLLSDVEREEG